MIAACVSPVTRHDVYALPDNCTLVVTTPSAFTPVGVSVMRATVRTSSAELTSSAQARATSPATSTE